ncbi:MAG: Eco57I restriction-modification methylase domain-containing protein [Promethearchaeota archaeon]
MELRENLNQFKKFIHTFYKNINTKNYKHLQTLIPSIKSFEEIFLRNYHRRKKEGVYYTDDHISSFISNEVLILLINKKLNDIYTKSPQIQSIEQIFKLDTDIQQKITESLLNITIFDPACGSGGFLISSIELIFQIIEKINNDLDTFKIKTKLLNNLYGYDINQIAIDLSILKLFSWIFDDNYASGSQIISQLKSNFQLINSLTYSNTRRFDIVIGNPPYGNILNNNEKALLKEENIFYNDIYCSFLLKALNWARGIIGLLVPKSFLIRQGYIEFRNQLLSRANLLKIIDIGSKIFKNATNEVQVLLYENKKEYSPRDLDIYNFPNSKIITYKNQNVDSLKICFNKSCPLCVKTKKIYVYTFRKSCPYCASETVNLNRIRIKPTPLVFQIIDQIEMSANLNYLNPKAFPKMIRGEEDKGLALIKKKLKHDVQGSCLFLNARNDFNYYFINRNKSVNIEEFSPQDLKGNNFEYYTSPKLLIKHNNIFPQAIYTKNNICFTSSVYSLLHDDLEELKYLCAVLNSILMQFYCIYAINNQKDTTINLNQYMIRHLPIIKPPNQLKLKLANNVDLINNLLGESNGVINQKISEILKETDNLVFTLYSISENNREIIISDAKKRIRFYENIYN